MLDGKDTKLGVVVLDKSEFTSTGDDNENCKLPFVIEDVPEGEPLYQIKIGENPDTVSYKRAVLDSEIGLTLGI